MSGVDIFTIVVYLTILFELTAIPVPSVASTYQLFFTEDDYDRDATLLARVRRWSPPLKVALLFIPTGLVVLIYLLPLLQALWPGASSWLSYAWQPRALWQVLLGVVVAIFGRIISLYTAWRMRENNRQKDDSWDLKTGAFFSRSRNPNLVGMYTCFVGLWLLYPSWLMAAGFVLYVANMHFRVLMEEDFLAWKFGRNYLDYKARMRRYV